MALNESPSTRYFGRNSIHLFCNQRLKGLSTFANTFAPFSLSRAVENLSPSTGGFAPIGVVVCATSPLQSIQSKSETVALTGDNFCLGRSPARRQTSVDLTNWVWGYLVNTQRLVIVGAGLVHPELRRARPFAATWNTISPPPKN